ncbi:MAG: hypothetical protein QW506_07660 [Thermoproteota archaeon]
MGDGPPQAWGAEVYTPEGQLVLDGDRIMLKSWEELDRAKSKRSVKKTLLKGVMLFNLHCFVVMSYRIKKWASLFDRVSQNRLERVWNKGKGIQAFVSKRRR